MYRSFEKAREFARDLKLETGENWKEYTRGKFKNLPPLPKDIPAKPNRVYKGKGWDSMGDWLGTNRVANYKRKFKSFEEARKFVRSLGLKSQIDWRKYNKGELKHLPKRPDDIPVGPDAVYREKGWRGYSDWLGNKKKK